MALTSSRIALSGHSVAVHVVCRSAACSGSMELTLKVAVAGRSGRRRLESVMLGRGSFSLVAGARGTVHIHLTRAGARRLAHVPGRHPLRATLSIAVTGGAPLSRPVRIG